MKKYIAAIAACLMLAVVLAGCRSENTPTAATRDPAQTESTQYTGETVSSGATETETTEAAGVPAPSNPDGILISTKYGDLYYQDQWEDFMNIQVTEKDTCVIVSFTAEIDGVKYPLFQLTVGEGGDEPVGQITDVQGVKHNVFVSMEEISGISNLTEGEQNRLYAMQEEINFILENLK